VRRELSFVNLVVPPNFLLKRGGRWLNFYFYDESTLIDKSKNKEGGWGELLRKKAKVTPSPAEF